jgi:hypothetical protein
MDPEYEKKMNSCGIQKGHEVQIAVREATGKMTQGEGALLWTKTGNEYGTMHAVIKDIYTALPEYRGKYLNIEVWNKTLNIKSVQKNHHVPENRIPRTL